MADRLADESALIVPAPEAEPVVRQWRQRLDRSASIGVPAHLTVLYPFAPPTAIDRTLLSELASLFEGFAPFDYALTDLQWFGQEVLWLSPTPDTPFRGLIHLAMIHFPAYPPYGQPGRDPIPHLTIGESVDAPALRAAEEAVRPRLPIDCSVAEVWLMESRGGRRWIVRDRFRLGGRDERFLSLRPSPAPPAAPRGPRGG
jgi:2'-5' RNA ligase superfamily